MSDVITIDSLPTVGTSGSLPPLKCARSKSLKDTDHCRGSFQSTASDAQAGSSSCVLSEYVDDTDGDCSSLSSESDVEESSDKGVQLKQPEAAKPVGRRPMVGVMVDPQPATKSPDLFKKVRAVLALMKRTPSKEERPSENDVRSRPSFAIKIQDTSTVSAAKPCLPSSAFSNVVRLAVEAKKTVAMTHADDALEQDTTKQASSKAAQSSPSSATSTARGASEDKPVRRAPHRRLKTQPASCASTDAAEQPPCQTSLDFTPSRPTSPDTSTSATPAVVKQRHSRQSLLVPRTLDNADVQALTPTRPTTARRGSAQTNFTRERYGNRDGSRSPCRDDSRSACTSERPSRCSKPSTSPSPSPSPCPVYSQKADAKGSGKDYNVVQFKATATVSDSRDNARSPSCRVSRRRMEEVVESEPTQSSEETAKQEVLNMFQGCSRSEVKRALRGTFSGQEVTEVLTLLGLNETKHQKRRSRSKREGA
eukprot:TRINITY_DN5736_c0_g2_i2.p1 TRINITY_DN5736_c0_g2~~TRINITY_DN5736_c0_g2_i2.p1  ORF type:complete len:480 (-),score=59.33 TRINITY_DN5736_c0_g2_i2:248-1687(-)